MKFEVDVDKKWVVGIITSLIFFAGVFFVIAYTPNPNAIVPNPGHNLTGIQAYFTGENNLKDTLGKFCQSDGTNCLIGTGNWNIVSVSGSSSFEGSGGPFFLPLGQTIPQNAKQILISVRAYSTSVSAPPGHYCGQVDTQEGSVIYNIPFCMYLHSGPSSNTDTFWLPVTSERRVAWRGPSISVGASQMTIEIIGYK